jgi:hypothetical protein
VNFRPHRIFGLLGKLLGTVSRIYDSNQGSLGTTKPRVALEVQQLPTAVSINVQRGTVGKQLRNPSARGQTL